MSIGVIVQQCAVFLTIVLRWRFCKPAFFIIGRRWRRWALGNGSDRPIRPAVAALNPGITVAVIGRTTISSPLVYRPVGAVESALNFLAGATGPVADRRRFALEVSGGAAGVFLELADWIAGTNRRRRWTSP